MNERVLIVKFGAIGDAIMVLPAVHRLHQAGYAIDWICGRAILPVLALYPWIHPILTDDRAILTGSAAARLRALTGLWRQLAAHRYALTATLYYDRRYRLITLPVRTRRRLLLSATDRGRRILPGRRHTDEFARILLDLPDERRPEQLAPVRPERLPASPLPAATAERICLAPAGARNMLAEATLRRWPAELYVTLAERLLTERPGCELVLIGGPDDAWVQPLFAPLAAHFGDRLTDQIGRLRLDETAALLDSADLLVTHDTGPLHLGGLGRASILALFGPTDPHVFLPARPGIMAIWGGEGFACRPCYDGHGFAPCPANNCMRQITVDQAFTEATALLDERARGELRPARILTPPTTMAGAGLIPAADLVSNARSKF